MSTAVNITIARRSTWETEEKKHQYHCHPAPCMRPDDVPKHPQSAALQNQMLALVRAILGDDSVVLSTNTVHRAQKAFLGAQQQQNDQDESKPNDSSSERSGDPNGAEAMEQLNEKLRQREATIETLKSLLEVNEDLLLEKDRRIHHLTDQIAAKFLEPNVLRKPAISSSHLDELRKKVLRKREAVRSKIDTVWYAVESSRSTLEVQIEKEKEQLSIADELVHFLQEEVALWKEKASLLEEEVKSSGNVAETKELEEKLAEVLENLKKAEKDKDDLEKGYQEFLDDTLECLKKSEAEVAELSLQVDAAVGFGDYLTTIDCDIAIDMDDILKRLTVTSRKFSEAKWIEKLQKIDRHMVRAACEVMLEAGQCIAVLKEGESMAAHDAVEAREVIEGDLNLYKKLLSLSNYKLEEANRKLKEAGQGIVFVEEGRAGEEVSEFSLSINSYECFTAHRVDL